MLKILREILIWQVLLGVLLGFLACKTTLELKAVADRSRADRSPAVEKPDADRSPAAEKRAAAREPAYQPEIEMATPSEKILEAKDFFSIESFEKALAILLDIDKQEQTLTDQNEAQLLRAKIALEQGNRYKAKFYLKKVIGTAKDADLRKEALISLGNISYSIKDYEEAYLSYLRLFSVSGLIVDRFPNYVWLRLLEHVVFYREDPESALYYLSKLESLHLSSGEKDLLTRIKKKISWNVLSTKELGLNDENVSALLVDNDDLWIGTWNGGLVRYSLSSHESTVFRAGKQSLVANTVRSLQIDSGKVWIGTYQGLYTYSKGNEKWKSVPQFDSSAKIQSILAVDNKLYVATLGLGLWRLSTQKWERVEQGALPGVYINCLSRFDNWLLIGTMNLGLILLDLETDRLVSFDSLNPGLAARNITMLLPQEGKQLWIGTYGGGLYRWQAQTNEMVHYSKETGDLGDNWVLCGIETERGLYFGTFGGAISLYDEATDSWRNLGLREGLSSLDISAVSSSPPYLFFGTLGAGISIFNEKL